MDHSPPFDLLICNGTAVLPDGVHQVDIGVRAGRIAAVAPALTGATTIVDAAGLLVLPGLVDPHVHMGIPIKQTWSADDFASGSIAAACGGVTTILDFTVQAPGQTIRAALDERLARAVGRSHVDFGIHVNITDRPAANLAAIPGLVADGFNTFKVFSTYREAGMMITWPDFRMVLAEIGRCGGLLMLHAEDNTLIELDTARLIAAGERAPINHPRSRTAEAEAAAIARAGEIALELGAPLYIVHLSSAKGLEAALWARAQGAAIFIETCPQYLALDESRYLLPNGHLFITTPPLRTAADVAALWSAVENGQIDAIGTDHCPFTVAQKDAWGTAFHETPNGMPGVENRLAVLWSLGVATGRITPDRLAALLATRPAELMGIAHRKGALAVGLDADLVIWDPRGETVMAADQMHGNADWTPYAGLTQHGRLTHTFLRGQPLVVDGRFVGHAVSGELITAR